MGVPLELPFAKISALDAAEMQQMGRKQRDSTVPPRRVPPVYRQRPSLQRHFWERRGGAAWAKLYGVTAVGVRASAARESSDLRRGRCLSRVDRQREGAEDTLRGRRGWVRESHVHIALELLPRFR